MNAQLSLSGVRGWQKAAAGGGDCLPAPLSANSIPALIEAGSLNWRKLIFYRIADQGRRLSTIAVRTRPSSPGMFVASVADSWPCRAYRSDILRLLVVSTSTRRSARCTVAAFISTVLAEPLPAGDMDDTGSRMRSSSATGERQAR